MPVRTIQNDERGECGPVWEQFDKESGSGKTEVQGRWRGRGRGRRTRKSRNVGTASMSNESAMSGCSSASI